jgi:hypothetical protein
MKKIQLEHKNKMVDKIKMAAKHEFSNQLKLGIWKESLKKNCGEALFSKLQNGGLNQDGVRNRCFFLSATVISQPILKRKPIY